MTGHPLSIRADLILSGLGKRQQRFAARFGLFPGARGAVPWTEAPFPREPRGLIALVGPSGVGKSLVLDHLRASWPRTRRLGEFRPRRDRTLLSHFSGALEQRARWLSRFGLADAAAFFQTPATLSAGQRERFLLALACARASGVLLVDDFAAGLDDVTARALAFNLGRLTHTDEGGGPDAVIVATVRQELCADLDPDWTLRLGHGVAPVLAQRAANAERAPCTVLSELQVEDGARADWEPFRALHYRSGALGVVDRVFRLCRRGEVVGVAVFAFAQRDAAHRRAAFPELFPAPASRDQHLRLMNDRLRVLQRLVLRPPYRGIGAASWFLKRCLERLDAPLVECFTELGPFSGFLERAGFTCWGASARAERSAPVWRALQGLALAGLVYGSPSHSAQAVERACESDASLRAALTRFRESARGCTSAGKRWRRRADRERRLDGPALAPLLLRLRAERYRRPAVFVWRRADDAASPHAP